MHIQYMYTYTTYVFVTCTYIFICWSVPYTYVLYSSHMYTYKTVHCMLFGIKSAASDCFGLCSLYFPLGSPICRCFGLPVIP